MNIFYRKKVFTAIFLWKKGLHRRFKPLVMSAHHQCFSHSSPTVREPAVMARPNNRRLKFNAPQTGGDSLFETAVMGDAGVVTLMKNSGLLFMSVMLLRK
jgi:hypothetical protein